MAAVPQPSALAARLQPAAAAAARPAAARRPHRRLPSVVAAAGARQAVPAPAVQVEPEPAFRVHAPTAVAVATVAAAAAVLWRRLSTRMAAASAREYPGISGLVRPAQSAAASELDPEYKMALARTRQATAVHRAVGFLNTGERARAHVEVRRALHQNSVCRAPLLNPGHSKGELLELYRLHLQQSDMPTDFGTLLQLRALLDLDFEEAEGVEREMVTRATFDI